MIFITPVLLLIKLACLAKHMDDIPRVKELLEKHNKQIEQGKDKTTFPKHIYQDIHFRMQMAEIYAILDMGNLVKSELELVKKIVHRYLFESLGWRARLIRGNNDELGTLTKLPSDICYEIVKYLTV